MPTQHLWLATSRALVAVAVWAALAVGCGGGNLAPAGPDGGTDAQIPGTGGATGSGGSTAGTGGTGGGSAGGAAAAGGAVGTGGITGAGGSGSGGAGGAVPPEYQISSMQTAFFTIYRDRLVAHARTVGDRTELSIFAATTNPNTLGVEEMTIVVNAVDPRPGSFPCVPGSVGITVRWYTSDGTLFNTYDNTHPQSACTITLTEIGVGGGGDLAGRFDGLIHDVNGGRLGVHNGTFRGPITP